MFEDFNTEEERSLCRDLADPVCAHMNAAPSQEAPEAILA